MKKIIAKKDFVLNNTSYIKDEEIKTRDFEVIKKLNEQGFIYPLEYKELILLKRELENSKIKEEEEYGTAL